MDLNKDFQRPIIYLGNWHKINALLDTGALFPVWTAPEIVLQNLGGALVRENVFSVVLAERHRGICTNWIR